jgi:hypothetical protein
MLEAHDSINPGTISEFSSAIGIPLAIKGMPTNRARAIQDKT